MENIISFILGILTNWFYTKIQRRQKPNLTISNKIIYNTETQSLIIKVINTGRRQIHDIYANFSIMERVTYKEHNKQINIIKFPAPLPQKVLVPKNERGKAWGLLYGCTFKVKTDNHDIKNILQNTKNERRIVVIIDSIDSESGTKLVQKQTYSYKDIEYNNGKSLTTLDLEEKIMNKNIECLIEACEKRSIKYTIHHSNLIKIIINYKSYIFANWTTPLNRHSSAYLQQDKDYFYNFFKNEIKMPRTKSYLNPHCDERYAIYLKHNTIYSIINNIENNFNYPFIIKKNRGTWGSNVFYVDTKQKLERSLITIFNENSNSYDYIALAQEYIDIKDEFRAVFYNKKLQLCYKKDNSNATISDNLSPFHQEGSKAIIINEKKLLETIEEFCKPIFKKSDIVYTGIDIAIDKNNKLWLIEANSSPGFDNIIKAGHKKEIVNLYEKILIDLEDDNKFEEANEKP